MTMTIGCVTGVFDLFQVGHLDLIRRAAQRCQRLVVVLPTDSLAEALGHGRPVVPYDERAEIVAEIEGVDAVVAMQDADLAGLLAELGCDVVFSHELDVPGPGEVALAAATSRTELELVEPLAMSVSELLRHGRFAARRAHETGLDSSVA